MIVTCWGQDHLRIRNLAADADGDCAELHRCLTVGDSQKFSNRRKQGCKQAFGMMISDDLCHARVFGDSKCRPILLPFRKGIVLLNHLITNGFGMGHTMVHRTKRNTISLMIIFWSF